MVIIGTGIAGLTAALYVGRMKLDTLVLENALVGDQIANAAGIENYPGFLSVSGAELMKTVKAQAEKYGAVVDEFDEINQLHGPDGTSTFIQMTGSTKQRPSSLHRGCKDDGPSRSGKAGRQRRPFL